MLRIFFIFLVLPFIALGQIPDPKPGTYINDFTNSLSAAQAEQLDVELHLLEKRTSIQTATLLINDLPANMALEDYARNVGNKWKVGNAFNGIVYVAVLNEHKQRLEIAKNLEGDIPDVAAFEIIESLKPYLVQKNYFDALEELIGQIKNHLGVTDDIDDSGYSGDEKQLGTSAMKENKKSEFDKEKAKYDHEANIVLVLLALVAAGICIWAYRYKKKYVAMYTVDGVYMGIGSIYYTGSDGDDSSTSGGSSAFGGSDGGGFSGGGASGSW
jgi:uncharacterized protein